MPTTTLRLNYNSYPHYILHGNALYMYTYIGVLSYWWQLYEDGNSTHDI